MPVKSKYQDQDVEIILNELVAVLQQRQVPTDLSLMVIGDLASHIINCNLACNQRKLIAEKFSQALLSSVATDQSLG